MKQTITWMVIVASFAAFGGCKSARQREDILANQRRMQEDLQRAEQQRQQMLQNQDDSKKRDEEMLRIAQTGVSTQSDILSIVKDNNTMGKAAASTLEKTFQEVYGVGVDLRSALGETRIVIAVNNDQPLRVHSDMPGRDGEVVDKLPIGAVIFQSKKVSDKWSRGIIFKEGQKTEVFFAAAYTRPLRDELMAQETGMAVGEASAH